MVTLGWFQHPRVGIVHPDGGRGTIMNNSKKSVTAKAKNSKAAPSKKQRKFKYSMPHTIIPLQDHDWALEQSPSVLKLWNECWRADPFGDTWKTINTKLSRKHFFKAKKALFEKGLFIFKREVSILDGRETVCFLVKNLHGSRLTKKGEFWNSQKDHQEESKRPPLVDKKTTSSGQKDHSIDPQTQSEQSIQKSSVSLQEVLSKSPKTTEDFQDSPNLKSETHDLDDHGVASQKQPVSVPSCSESEREPEKAPKTEKEIYDPWMSPEKNALSPTEKAILEEQATEEYQTASREKAAELRAFVNGLKKKNKLERDARLRGESFIPTQEKSELEEKKIE